MIVVEQSGPVVARERRRDRAVACARQLRAYAAGELRVARRTAALSIREAAASVGMHPSTYGRIERNELPAVGVEQLALAGAAVGLEPAVRMYPRADPVRDAAHLRLLERFPGRLPASLQWRTEVPLPAPGDLRALDAQTWIGSAMIAIEAETRLTDLQAVGRRLLLKKRDAGAARLILLVADTRHNRDVLAAHRAGMRGSFPLDTRDVLAALALAELPRGDAIVVL